ncbi:MAG: hypothetical protein KKD01_02010 [Proteobacteria bacterium]|nr:hypothetical protein [Pseudomonadota bacterium]MBU1137406.1 hypothetical protein [Pseudomonadota bacterium]MBU1420320.1 hypothetical protein [Pseudomonadota bacterium]MBU1453474.1 hypothetical protein [Pseudomonadota bacterium]
MKKSNRISQHHYLQQALPAGCWAQVNRNKNNSLKRLLKRYQKKIDTAFAAMAIGLMFLTGIWVFLIQLAEFGVHS